MGAGVGAGTGATGAPDRTEGDGGAPLALPAVPSAFQELHSLPAETLEGLLTDEAAYRDFASKLGYVGELDAAFAEYAAGNAERARANLDLVSQISDLKNQIAVIRSSEEPQVRQRFTSLLERHDEVLRVLDPSALLKRLEAAVEEVDGESAELSEAFCAGKVGTDEFVESYLKLRTLYHQRDIKRQAVVRTAREEQAAGGLHRCDAFHGHSPGYPGGS